MSRGIEEQHPATPYGPAETAAGVTTVGAGALGMGPCHDEAGGFGVLGFGVAGICPRKRVSGAALRVQRGALSDPLLPGLRAREISSGVKGSTGR